MDVTKQHRTRDELGAIQHEQLRLVAHDLRQPLNTISMAADAAMSLCSTGQRRVHPEDTTGPASVEAVGRTIKSSIRAMSDALEDILDAGESKNGELRLDVRPTDLVDLVRLAVESGVPHDRAHRVIVRAQKRCGANVDRNKVRRVISNLVDNALKFSPHSEPVSVEIDRVYSAAVLTVRDSGAGMDSSTLLHIFEAHHASESSRAEGGRGLGLYATRMIVEAHGGRIGVDSAPGKGSTFVVELPARHLR